MPSQCSHRPQLCHVYTRILLSAHWGLNFNPTTHQPGPSFSVRSGHSPGVRENSHTWLAGCARMRCSKGVSCLFLVFVISPLEASPSDLRPNTQLTEHPSHLPLSLALFFFFFLVDFVVLFIFNWRIVALQCCVGFCRTST